MKSSYQENNYEDIFKLLITEHKPKIIIEFGILDGYSLKAIIEAGNLLEQPPCIIGYDIFEEFNGNHASKEIINKFEVYDNVSVRYGDFFIKYMDIDNFDMIHIDIANDGDVYKFAMEHYYPKLNQGGIMILEGGSEQRDNVWWMTKYNKRKIVPYIDRSIPKNKVIVIDKYPSITIIYK